MFALAVASARRNGLPSSCEPCRKSKLKCDHSTPVCDRCKRRGKAESCVYHPAPLTQSRPSGGPTSLTNPRKRKHEEGRKSADAENNGLSTAKDPPETTSSHSPGSEGIIAKLGHWGKTRASVSTPGFLGLTSYSAVFSENEGNLGVATQNGVEQDAKDLSCPAVEPETVDPRHIQLGAQLLLLLDDLMLYEVLAERWYEISGGFVIGEPMIRMALKSMKEEFDFLLLGSVDKKPTMLTFSKKIFDNSVKPIETSSSMTSGEYISLVAGPNARWEMVGLVFSILGLGAVLAPPWDPIFNRERDGKPIIEKKDFGVQATEAADICLQFCDSAGTMNDPLSWLLFQHTHLLTLVYGDNGMSISGRVAHPRSVFNVHDRLPAMEKTRRLVNDHLRSWSSSNCQIRRGYTILPSRTPEEGHGRRIQHRQTIGNISRTTPSDKLTVLRCRASARSQLRRACSRASCARGRDQQA